MNTINAQFWQGKRVFLTGHTGFKGGWLALWLQSMGAKVTGFALSPPTSPNFFDVCDVANGMTSIIGDIRDLDQLKSTMQNCAPDIVIHMAAQALVRYSYDHPVETYSTNVMGTVNLLEAVRQVGNVKAVVNVTTDKCYENKEWVWGYRENEPMGGSDPYSNSKGCSELVTSAYRDSFFRASDTAVATARAGNVIGGGDWSLDRLIPDFLRAIDAKQTLVVRSPNAIRPWQHVLEPLSGYLTLAENLFTRGNDVAQAWNFGPSSDDSKTVGWIVSYLASKIPDMNWTCDNMQQVHEAHFLTLDSSKAKALLNWQGKWPLATALEYTLDWHKAWHSGKNMREISLEQIAHHSQHQPNQ